MVFGQCLEYLSRPHFTQMVLFESTLQQFRSEQFILPQILITVTHSITIVYTDTMTQTETFFLFT